MADYEQLFREGLQQAVRRRPPVAVDPVGPLTRKTDDDDAVSDVVPATGQPQPVARPRPGVRWAIGLSAAAAVVAVLVLASGAVTLRPIEASPGQTPVPTMTAVPAPTPSGELAPRWGSAQTIAPDDLPLTPYWDAVRRAEDYENRLAAASDYRTWWDAREAFLPICLAESGFDYVPERRAWDGPEPGSEAEARAAIQNHNRLRIPGLDADRAVVTQVGYGLRSAAAELPGQDAALIDDAQNTAYLDSLSPARQKKYKAALDGCRAQFQRKNPVPDEPYRKNFISARFGDLLSDLVGFHVRGSTSDIEADPRIVQLNSEWRACMAPSGLPIEDDRAWSTKPGPWDGPVAAYLIAVRTGADGLAADPGDDPARIDQQSLVGSEPEFRIALADYDCRASTGYLDRFIAVQREHEQAFLDVHRKELDKLVAYVDTHVP
ncbi:MAG: hypothetical protein VB080_05520 [Propionicimonas sp.]|uniref:hypothetical protein n=1 Tax=Propionicimonas sp. TaxID=1955623 RepID=UPI002B2156AE|nr:hypothetical protein [Propionicimonas sp.]MEA4943884.1 hypothetical protein [Propionicimonas sp.]